METVVKLFLLFLNLLSVSTFSADTSSCPGSLKNNLKAREAFSFIRPYEGQFQMGSCQIEIRVCSDEDSSEDESSSFAADMLITDSKGFERYIPFFVAIDKSSWSKDILFLTKRAFIYRFNDNNSDQATGRFERWDVEIVKNEDLQSIDYIEVGYSSESEQESRAGKNWIICGTEREKEVLENPVRHKFKSWWWWLTHPGTR
jgi:hypothetical protein